MRFKIAAESNSNLNARLTVESDPEWIQTIPFSMFEATDGGYYLYYKGLNAGQMSEAVYITIYDGDTPVSNTLRYSVESYAYTQMNKENADEDLLSLLRAMMKYGDSANNYVD